MKNKVDKLDVDKLVPFLVDFNKLSDVVKNDVVKKEVHNAKIEVIEGKIPDIANVATNGSLNTKINRFKGEIPSNTSLATTTTAALNATINEIKGEIPNITNLATNTAFTAVENKIPNVSNLNKKTDYNTKICEIKN